MTEKINDLLNQMIKKFKPNITLKNLLKLLAIIAGSILFLFIVGSFFPAINSIIATLIFTLFFIGIACICLFIAFKGIEYTNKKNDERIKKIENERLAIQKQKEQIKIAKQKALQAKYDKSNQIINDIPNYHISVVQGNRINRAKMIDMPEIKLSSITKSTNIQQILNNYVSIDVETTGLAASKERIIQISAIRFENGEPVEKFNTYINPKRHIPDEASKINGITDDMVSDSPIIGEVADSFLKFIGKSAIIGYNISFDLKFLYMEGIDLITKRRKIYDVYTLVKKSHINANTSNSKLETIAKYIDVYADAHNSLADCYLTNAVFLHLIQNGQYYKNEYDMNRYQEW